jgi:hypothetical protein
MGYVKLTCLAGAERKDKVQFILSEFPLSGGRQLKGSTPLESPTQMDGTPLDTPRGEKGILPVAGDANRRGPERSICQTLLIGAKERCSLSNHYGTSRQIGLVMVKSA